MSDEMMDRRAVLRQMMTVAGAASALVCAPRLVMAAPSLPLVSTNDTRILALQNSHTGEKLREAYVENGKYVPEVLAEINRLMRDHRNNAVHVIDPQLLDILCVLQRDVAHGQPFELISGYRSPASNAMLHAKSGGVAKKSMHLQGKAADIRLPGQKLSRLREAACALKCGGVGYYPESSFVHVDTGRVRYW